MFPLSFSVTACVSKLKEKKRWNSVKLCEINYLTGWRKWSMNRKVVSFQWWNWFRGNIVRISYLTVNHLSISVIYLRFLNFWFLHFQYIHSQIQANLSLTVISISQSVLEESYFFFLLDLKYMDTSLLFLGSVAEA